MEGPISPPPLPVTPLPYASPARLAVTEGLWREGNKLVVVAGGNRTARLPRQCVKCNAPTADRKPWRKTVSWHHPGYYALIPLGLLIYALVAVSVSKKVTVEAGLCRAHAAVRRNRILIGWGIFLASIAALVLAIYCWDTPPFRHGPAATILGILSGALFVGSMVWGLVAPRVLAVRRVVDNTAWFSGAGPEFLASLPSA